MFKDFKEFAIRGNVLDMAVGVIMGAAFGKIVASFVADIVMPPLGLVMGAVDLKHVVFTLKPSKLDAATGVVSEAISMKIGIFLTSVIDFVLVAYSIFIMVKIINRLKKQAPPPLPNTRECPKCVSAIPKKASRCAFCTSEVAPAA